MGVSPATLRALANDGRVETYRTPGGHRRFRLTGTAGLPQAEKTREVVPWRLLKLSALGRVQIALETSRSPRRLGELPPLARAAFRKAGRDVVELLTRALKKEEEQLEKEAVALGHQYAKLQWQHSLTMPEVVAALDFFRGVFLESVVEFAFGIGEPEVDRLNGWLRRSNEIIDQICLSMLEYRAEETPKRVRKAHV
jgi:hypothetical protein